MHMPDLRLIRAHRDMVKLAHDAARLIEDNAQGNAELSHRDLMSKLVDLRLQLRHVPMELLRIADEVGDAALPSNVVDLDAARPRHANGGIIRV